MTTPALQGVKVLELGHFIAGPYCGKLLASHGADVVKIEIPGTGDSLRHQGPYANDDPNIEKSIPFLYLNTSKRSITLDVKEKSGLAITRWLAEKADILIENYSPGTLSRLGLGYAELSKTNPGIIVVSISNFGQTGPYRDYKASDLVEYAMGGLMSIFGDAGKPPLKHALNQAQYKAGTYAAGAGLIALYSQRLTNQGEWVDISIHESLVVSLRDTISAYVYQGAVRGRPPRNNKGTGRVVPARDGHVVPIPYGGVDWEVLANFLDAPEFLSHRFQSFQQRLLHAQEFNRLLEEALRKWEASDLFHQAQEWGLVFGFVQDIRTVLETPHLQDRGYFTKVNHPVAGVATYPGQAVAFSMTPGYPPDPAPLLGQHTEEVLSDWLGLNKQEVDDLLHGEVAK